MNSVKYIHLDEVDSTNSYLRQLKSEQDARITVVTAEFQSAGKGQGENVWESNPGENLLFSVLIHPQDLDAKRQFLLSQAMALAVRDALRVYIGDIEVKWPNDIYWHNHKLGGILIECNLSGSKVRDCIVGVGIDVNQEHFENLTKNPISIYQITHRHIDRQDLLHSIIEDLDHYIHMIEDHRYDEVNRDYQNSLYRRYGYHLYKDGNGEFMARFVTVEPSGRIVLKDDSGYLRTYAFKEVKFMIEGKNV